jgi:uncharacterized protein (DUF1330 family)
MLEIGNQSGRIIMKTQYTIALTLITGVAIGAVAVDRLHAQAKPPVYVVTEINVTDPENYGKEFAPKAQASIKAAGGRQLAIGGTGGANAKPVAAIEGDAPKRVTINVWESMDAFNKWYNGAEYQAALKIGEKYAKFRRYAIEGTGN